MLLKPYYEAMERNLSLILHDYLVSYFNWIWQHSRTSDSAAMRAGLATKPWVWNDIATYPTFY